MAVPEIQIVDQAYRFRVLMYFVEVLANRKIVPLLVGQREHEFPQFTNLNIAYE
jgi:hypothetical protein